jgi:hypothetical protein
MANQNAKQDDNQFPAMIGHSGTAGTAETRRQVVNDYGASRVSVFDSAGSQINSFGQGTVGIYTLGGVNACGSVALGTTNAFSAVPGTALANRITIILNNRSGDDMYWTLGTAGTAQGTSSGMLFPNGGQLSLDLDNSLDVYVRHAGTSSLNVYYQEVGRGTT